MWHVLKMVINSATIGTQAMAIHVTESAVIFLSTLYRIRNMLVLVIGRTELIIITANHAGDIVPSAKDGSNIRAVSIGVIATVRISIFLTYAQ